MCLRISNHKGSEKEENRALDFVVVKPFVFQAHSKVLPLLMGSSKHLVLLLLRWFHLEMGQSFWPSQPSGGTACCWHLLLPLKALLRDSYKQYPMCCVGCWLVMTCNSKVSVCGPTNLPLALDDLFKTVPHYNAFKVWSLGAL